MFFKKRIFDPNKNRMKDNGDVVKAREYFFLSKNKNLHFLLKKRFSWMNDFINKNDKVLELGSGASLLKEFINNNIETSDLSDFDHIDHHNIDACKIDFPDQSFDVVISSNLIHHIAYPLKHFQEVNRILKNNGLYLVQDVNCSLSFQLVVMMMNHGGFDCSVNVTDENVPCCNPHELFEENLAVPNLIFDDFKNFDKKLGNKFEILHNRFSEFFIFLNSGGVTAKTFYLPMNNFFLNFLFKLDNILSNFPKIFALQRSTILKKK